MKRRGMIKKIEEIGCVFIRHGRKHIQIIYLLMKYSLALYRERLLKNILMINLIQVV